MSQRHLKIRLHGTHCADLSRSDRTGALSIQYTQDWLSRSSAVPLSVRLPLRQKPFGDDVAVPFVAGLLPDSKIHRRLIASAVHIDAEDPSDYALLERIGRDCAGAVSIVPPDQADEPELAVVPSYDPIDDTVLAAMIRELPQRPLLVGDDDDVRLSLAGVNDKAAVVQVDGRVALPKGGTPSTHILKVDIPRLPDSIRTEHFSLRLASSAGLLVPRSRIGVAEDQVYMLIERYDRKLVQHDDGPRIRRLHQEDAAQALGYAPEMKYERDGGPSWRQMFKLMESTTDAGASRLRLLDTALFQWFVDNPDAHAKNYSLVHDAGRTSLSPYYDGNVAFAFRDCFTKVRPRMAMAIGGVYDPNLLTGEHWQEFAEQCGFPPKVVAAKIRTMARRLPSMARDLEASMRGTSAWSPRLEQVLEIVQLRADSVPDMLARNAASVVEATDASSAEETSIFSLR